MIRSTYQKKSGFSLVETLIAITILMIAITGPLSLVQAGLFSSNHERNEVTAIYLAQEAIEYIKNIRDTNAYFQYSGSPRNWLTIPTGDGSVLLSDNAGCGVSCYVDPHGKLSGTNQYVQKVSLPASQYLRLKVDTRNYTNGVFTYSYDTTGTLTPFIRTVSVVPVADSQTVNGYNEVTVTVTVTWSDNLLPRTYSISTNMFNYAQGSGA